MRGGSTNRTGVCTHRIQKASILRGTAWKPPRPLTAATASAAGRIRAAIVNRARLKKYTNDHNCIGVPASWEVVFTDLSSGPMQQGRLLQSMPLTLATGDARRGSTSASRCREKRRFSLLGLSTAGQGGLASHPLPPVHLGHMCRHACMTQACHSKQDSNVWKGVTWQNAAGSMWHGRKCSFPGQLVCCRACTAVVPHAGTWGRAC